MLTMVVEQFVSWKILRKSHLGIKYMVFVTQPGLTYVREPILLAETTWAITTLAITTWAL